VSDERPAPLGDTAIRAVLFDLDGTLYASTPLRVAMAAEMALVSAATIFRGGARVPRVIATFRRTRERLRAPLDGGPALDRGPTIESGPPRDGHPPIVMAQYTAAAEALGTSAGEVERIVDEWMYRRPLKWLRWCRRRGLVELLDWLDRNGLRKGVLSDYPAEDKVAALGLAGRFDPIVSAVDPDVDAFKPNPRGYLEAASRWGLDPAEVLYVGDRADVDVEGARAAGMPRAVLTRQRVDPDVIRIKRFSELEDVLARRP
jgi:HAD superfamily hydrolase (TIGR01509 family)